MVDHNLSTSTARVEAQVSQVLGYLESFRVAREIQQDPFSWGGGGGQAEERRGRKGRRGEGDLMNI